MKADKVIAVMNVCDAFVVQFTIGIHSYTIKRKDVTILEDRIVLKDEHYIMFDQIKTIEFY